jgi:thioredoxin-like negative regulator of GroEL
LVKERQVRSSLKRSSLMMMMMMTMNMSTRHVQDKFKNKLNDPAVAKALAAVDLRAELAGKSGGQDLKAKVAEWRDKLEKDPKDLQTRYDLAHALFSTGQTEEALDQILDLVKRFVLPGNTPARVGLVAWLTTELGTSTGTTKRRAS